MATLDPGIYVAARRINESGLARLGSHQFVVMVIGDEAKQCYANATVVEKHNVIVLGAYNIDGKLLPAYNATSDVGALRNHLSGASKLDIEKVKTSTDLNEARALLQLLTYTYEQKSKKKAIAYPASGGLFESKCLNSNSFAQSIVEYAFGKNAVKEDFDGMDICNSNRIPTGNFY